MAVKVKSLLEWDLNCCIEAGTKVFLLKEGDIINNAEKSIAEAAQFLPGIQRSEPKTAVLQNSRKKWKLFI